MWTFLGLLFLTGVVQKGRLENYWSREPMLDMPYFRTYMSRNRFQLLKFLHFADSSQADDNDKIWMIRHVYDYLNNKFTENYHPSEHLSLDEGILAWHGRLV